ncbi:CIC11C00000004563 [Sungouiella intermedia]|uniref:CIC11C00000004563 n=1 Tax=Sungouiella intermedia TaxID=45354 RepID=A0A1L0DAZ2_9ASCO|nr:CIC11C00000004563 [[Candida] intermedia]
MSDSNLDIKHDLNINLNRDLRDFKDFKESPRDLPVLQRKSSSVLNSLASKKLCHQPSKLDLIDDTTLTSLPLPPRLPRSASDVAT